jgi:hypothetical protein
VERAGKRYIADGHHRAAAAKLLGKTVKVYLIEDKGTPTVTGSWAEHKIALRAAWLDPETGIDDHGRGQGGGKDRTRADRARASHNPATRDKHIIATQQEQIVAKAIGGRIEAGNAPIDVWTDHSAVEVKTIVGGKNAKITMHPASRMRKEAAAKKAGKAPHTVAIDHRGPKPIYYHRAGYGSYRLEHMARVSLSQLKERIK